MWRLEKMFVITRIINSLVLAEFHNRRQKVVDFCNQTWNKQFFVVVFLSLLLSSYLLLSSRTFLSSLALILHKTSLERNELLQQDEGS